MASQPLDRGFIGFGTPKPFEPPTIPPPEIPTPENSPGGDQPLQTKPEHKHTTRRGRVVYNRKRHFATIGTAARILRAVLAEENGIPANTGEIIRDLVLIYGVLIEIMVKSLPGSVLRTALAPIELIISILEDFNNGRKR